MDYWKSMTKGVTSLIDKTLGDPDEGRGEKKSKKDKKDKKEKKSWKERETKSSSNSDNKSQEEVKHEEEPEPDFSNCAKH